MGQPEVQFVAICDLQKKQRLAVKNFVDTHYGSKDCAMYPEINGFLAERPDIDAVLIATGDHWHAMASILAMRAGKDVYTEKPSCMTIAEGRAVVETARRYGRVYQTGTQRLSEANHVFAIEMARTGRLGKIHTAYAHIAPWDAAEMRHDWLPAVAQPPKDEVDWDAWLGACPWRPYNPGYVAGGWRGFYDFHTSCIGEWGAHTFAQAQAGLGCGESSPVEYEYVANDSGDGMVTHFANGVRMILSRGNKYWHGSCGERFDGSEGWAAAADGYSQARRLFAGHAGRVQEGRRRLRGPHGQGPEPHAELHRLHQEPPADGGQPGSDAPLHDHGPRRQHLHVAQAKPQVRPGQRGVRRRRRGQPPPLAGHAGTVHLLE